MDGVKRTRVGNGEGVIGDGCSRLNRLGEHIIPLGPAALTESCEELVKTMCTAWFLAGAESRQFLGSAFQLGGLERFLPSSFTSR